MRIRGLRAESLRRTGELSVSASHGIAFDGCDAAQRRAFARCPRFTGVPSPSCWNAVVAKGARHLIADLDGLQYVGSMGLRSFLAVAQKLQSMSGSLIMVTRSSAVMIGHTMS